MKRIRELEALPSFSDSRANLLNEQIWFKECMDGKITQELLVEKVKALEKKNLKTRGMQIAEYTGEEVIKATEKWLKEFIIGES